MTISMVLPLPIGNALKVFLEPPAFAQLWRVLRKPVGTPFSDQSDPNAFIVYQGDQSTFLVDAKGLVNGTPYAYCAFYFDGASWIPSNVASATPNVSCEDQSVDVLSIVRDRLDVGLQNEVAAGTLLPHSGHIPVLNATPSYEDTRWPLVTVHVAGDGSGDRAIGESIGDDDFDPLSGEFEEGEGWLARVQLTVVGWSKNPDERIALRQALRRLLIGNLPVFDASAMTQIEWSQSDSDLVSGEYPAPIYQAICSLHCHAPAFITSAVDKVADVSLTVQSSLAPPA